MTGVAIGGKKDTFDKITGQEPREQKKNKRSDRICRSPKLGSIEDLAAPATSPKREKASTSGLQFPSLIDLFPSASPPASPSTMRVESGNFFRNCNPRMEAHPCMIRTPPSGHRIPLRTETAVVFIISCNISLVLSFYEFRGTRTVSTKCS